MSIRKLNFWAVIAVAIVSISIFAEEEKKMPVADQPSVKLWDKHIRDNPVKILDDWELVEPLSLVKQAGKIDNKLAVFAIVAFAGSNGASVGDFVMTEKQFIVFAQDLKGTALTEDETEKIKALFIQTQETYGDRSIPIRYGTFLMGKALSLGLTVNDSSWLKDVIAKIGIGDKKANEADDWIRRSVDRIGKIHGWHATVEEGNNIPFEKFKEAVDKRIPVIIEKDRYYRLVVGYIDIKDGQRYVVVADPANTPLEQVGMSYPLNQREYFESRPPDDSRRKSYEHKKNKKRFAADLQIRSRMPLPIGITIEEFEQGKYHVYFVYGWHKSMEVWEDEIGKIVGKKAE